MLEKTVESSLDSKEIKPVNPKGNQPWIFIERTYAETLILWPPDAKSQLTGKDPDAGKDWRQEKGTTEDEMVGWHHQLNGHEFEQVPRVGDEQGSLACCSPWGFRGSDTTEWLNSNNNGRIILAILIFSENLWCLINLYSEFQSPSSNSHTQHIFVMLYLSLEFVHGRLLSVVLSKDGHFLFIFHSKYFSFL